MDSILKELNLSSQYSDAFAQHHVTLPLFVAMIERDDFKETTQLMQ